MRVISPQREQAKLWLQGALSQGSRNTTEIRALATEFGIAGTTLYAARRDLGIETLFVEFGVWHWRLPETANNTVT